MRLLFEQGQSIEWQTKNTSKQAMIYKMVIKQTMIYKMVIKQTVIYKMVQNYQWST